MTYSLERIEQLARVQVHELTEQHCVSGRMQRGPRMEEHCRKILYHRCIFFFVDITIIVLDRCTVGVKLNVQVCESDQMSARLPPLPAVSILSSSLHLGHVISRPRILHPAVT